MMIRNAFFYLNQNKSTVYEAAAYCASLCRERGIEPIFCTDDAKGLADHILDWQQAGYALAPKPDEALHDFIFVFGGDGTVLRALDQYVTCGIPILGINLGRLGFLLETEVHELAEALDSLLAGEYSIEHRMMLHIMGYCGGTTIDAYATNEVCVSRGLSQRMIALDAYVGSTLVDHFIADGLVLASPTGSTAYSLSTGGPIVSPDVNCFVLSPVCPHSLQSRPIVLSSGEKVRLRIDMKESREGIQLSVDGQAICRMNNHEEITVVRSEKDALLVRFPRERNFYSLLKDKLSQWSL